MFNALKNNTSLIAIEANPQGDILAFNIGFEIKFRHTVLTYKTDYSIYDIIHPLQWPLVKRLISTNNPLLNQSTHLLKTTTTKSGWAEFEWSICFNEQTYCFDFICSGEPQAKSYADMDMTVFLDRINETFLILNSEGVCLEVSNNWSDRYGFLREDLVGMHFSDFVPEEDHQLCQEAFSEVVTNWESHPGIIHRLILKSGEQRWLNTRSYVYPDYENIFLISEDVHEKEVANFRFAHQQQIFQKLAELSPEVSFVFNYTPQRGFAFSYVAEKIKALLGVSDQQVYSKWESIFGDFSEVSRLKIIKTFFQSRHEKKSFRIESAYHTRLGNRRIIEIKAQPDILSDGQINWYGHLQDITEIYEVNRNLERSYRLLDSVTENIPGVLFRLQISQNGVLSIPYMTYGLINFSKNDIDSFKKDFRVLGRLIFKEDRMKVVATLRFSQRKLKPWNVDFRVKKKGRYAWIRLMATPSLDENGDFLWNGHCMDISKEFQLRERLIDSNKLFNSIISNVPIGIYIFRKGKYQIMNTYFCNIFGLEKEDIQNQPRIITERIQIKEERSENISETNTSQMEIHHFEAAYQHPEGEVRYLMINSGHLHDHSSEYELGIVMDVTERKVFEQKLQEQNDKLSELSFYEAHIVRAPIATMLGIINVIDLETDEETKFSLMKELRPQLNILDEVIRTKIRKMESF
ncbi:MAG: PAS domain S-box protein [Cyclobacteriaceae bacterium]|nr:PAS domain S-box protein [Cyclobacteriaceae bacterium]MCH8516584.1 PAS domain S-box protein [Cyclobacteriaceae bacterium]